MTSNATAISSTLGSTATTDMGRDATLPDAAFDQKYGVFRTTVDRAWRARHPLGALDATVAAVENGLAGKSLDQPLDRPIFVLGNFRSGTTWLEQVLASHPALGHLTLATSAFPRSPRFASWVTRHVPGFDATMIAPHQPNMQVDGNSPFEAESLWRFCRNNLWTDAPSNVLGSDYTDPTFERLLHRTIVKQLRLVAKPRFLHKNPCNTVRLGFLARLFPSARFVYIVRHPQRMLRSQLDMLAAYERMFGNKRNYGEAFSNLFVPDAKAFMRTSRHPEIAAAFAQDRALGLAMSLTDVHAELDRMRSAGLQERVLTVRYEDLTADYNRHMPDILQHCGLNDAGGEAVLAEAKSIDNGLLSRQAPLPEFSAEVLTALKPLMAAGGY